MKTIAPDDLEIGREYEFSYLTASGEVWTEKARFKGFFCEYGTLWLNWWMPHGYVCPFDYGCIQQIREV